MKYICTECKNPVKEKDKYCQICGSKLIWEKPYSQEIIKQEDRKEKKEESSPGQKKFLEQEILKWKEKNIISESLAISILKEYGL